MHPALRLAALLSVVSAASAATGHLEDNQQSVKAGASCCIIFAP